MGLKVCCCFSRDYWEIHENVPCDLCQVHGGELVNGYYRHYEFCPYHERYKIVPGDEYNSTRGLEQRLTDMLPIPQGSYIFHGKPIYFPQPDWPNPPRDGGGKPETRTDNAETGDNQEMPKLRRYNWLVQPGAVTPEEETSPCYILDCAGVEIQIIGTARDKPTVRLIIQALNAYDDQLPDFS